MILEPSPLPAPCGDRVRLEFTTYPDVLDPRFALLQIGKGAYISNRATLGTNIVMRDGMTLVEGITVGEGATVGHLVRVGLGTRIGERAGIGVGAVNQVELEYRCGARIAPCCGIDHGVEIGAGVKIGSHCYVGSQSRIAANLVIPPGTVIPPRFGGRECLSAAA